MTNHTKNAAQAYSNMTTYHIIINICENSLFYGSRPNEPLRKILQICKNESIKELRIFDAEARKTDD